MPPILTLVAWSTVLLVVHILLAAQLSTRERGVGWNAGPRDGEARPLGPLASRAQRASDNFRETYPAFVALALALAASGETLAAGALVWLVARIVYLPLYLAGVPYLRSLVWLVSMIGLGMMLAALS